MERIVFPIPDICEYLTEETKTRIYYDTERDEQGSKVADFFEKVEDMFAEMRWQKKLRGRHSIISLIYLEIHFVNEYDEMTTVPLDIFWFG